VKKSFEGMYSAVEIGRFSYREVPVVFAVLQTLASIGMVGCAIYMSVKLYMIQTCDHHAWEMTAGCMNLST